MVPVVKLHLPNYVIYLQDRDVPKFLLSDNLKPSSNFQAEVIHGEGTPLFFMPSLSLLKEPSPFATYKEKAYPTLSLGMNQIPLQCVDTAGDKGICTINGKSSITNKYLYVKSYLIKISDYLGIVFLW